MARMNLVGFLLATAALGSCFLSAVPTQTPRAPAPKQVESLGAPQMENQKTESCWVGAGPGGKLYVIIIVDVWKEGGLQIQFMCWMGHCCWILVLQMMYCLMAYSKKNTIWWQWNIHWFGNKQIKYARSSDTFSYSLHGDAPGTNTDWWWFRLHKLQYILTLQLFFCCSPFSPFHKNELPTFLTTHFFLQRLLLGCSFVELRRCSWHRLRLGSSATSEGHYCWTIQSVDLCTGVAVGHGWLGCRGMVVGCGGNRFEWSLECTVNAEV